MKHAVLVLASASVLVWQDPSWTEPTALPAGRAAPAASGAHLGRQMLANPGCEKRARQGEIPGWTELQGTWKPRSKKGGRHPGPKKGRFYFAPSSATKLAVLYQEVDLSRHAREIASGGIEIVLKGSVAAYRQKGGDRSQVRLEWVTPRGTERGAATKPMHSPEWKAVELIETVPRDASAVRVVLVARRVKGSCRQSNNDGCFDDLSLRLRKRRE